MGFENNQIFLDGNRVESPQDLPDNFDIKFSSRSKENTLFLQPVRGNGKVTIDLRQAVSCKVSMGTGNSIINGTLAVTFPMNASRPAKGAYVELGHLNSFTGSATLQAPFTPGAGLKIGSKNLIAPGLSTRGSNHGVYDLQTGLRTNVEIGSRIGSRNWFGNGVHVFNRGAVGSDCIVGLGSVINKDNSEMNHVALGGAPAQVVKRGVAWTRELYYDTLDEVPRPALTIGIATYERPTSLTRLLESVITQRLPENTNVEIVVTDDGSQSEAWRNTWDGLEGLCDVKGFQLIKLRNPEPTRGPSAARNAAIEVGTGTHILFLDDDDYLVKDSLHPLINSISTCDADRIALRYTRGERSRFRSPGGRQERQEISESLWTMLPPSIYRLDRLREFGVRFPAGVSYGEDNEFVLSYSVRASQFATFADCDYIVIGDPAEGEPAHISQGTGSWHEFLLSVLSHVNRLGQIIDHAELPEYVKDRLVETVLLNRGVMQYQLVRRIVDYSDPGVAEELLRDLSRTVNRVAHVDVVQRFAKSVSASEEFDAIIEANLPALRLAYKASLDSKGPSDDS